MHRLATIHNVTDDRETDDDRRNTVPIARPSVRLAKNLTKEKEKWPCVVTWNYRQLRHILPVVGYVRVSLCRNRKEIRYYCVSYFFEKTDVIFTITLSAVHVLSYTPTDGLTDLRVFWTQAAATAFRHGGALFRSVMFSRVSSIKTRVSSFNWISRKHRIRPRRLLHFFVAGSCKCLWTLLSFWIDVLCVILLEINIYILETRVFKFETWDSNFSDPPYSAGRRQSNQLCTNN